MKLRTITEIMEANPGAEGRILLKSTNKAQNPESGFIPWYHNQGRGVWYGAWRHKGRNNKDTTLSTRPDSKKIWRVERQPFPILPKGHPVRIKLERQLKRG